MTIVNNNAAARIVRTLWPANHPIYQPCDPPLSPFGLMAAIDTAWTVAYQRGFSDGADSVPPRVIEKRVTVTKDSDKAVIIQRIRALAAAMDRQLEGRSKLLVDLHTTQQKLFQGILDDLLEL